MPTGEEGGNTDENVGTPVEIEVEQGTNVEVEETSDNVDVHEQPEEANNNFEALNHEENILPEKNETEDLVVSVDPSEIQVLEPEPFYQDPEQSLPKMNVNNYFKIGADRAMEFQSAQINQNYNLW